MRKNLQDLQLGQWLDVSRECALQSDTWEPSENFNGEGEG